MLNHWTTIQELVDKAQRSIGSAHSIVTEDLAIWRVSCVAPCDFMEFLKLKKTLKGTCSESWEVIMQDTIVLLYSIPNDIIQQCFQRWNNSGRSVCGPKEYFEGD